MKRIVSQQTKVASFVGVEQGSLFEVCAQSFSLEVIDLGLGQKAPRR